MTPRGALSRRWPWPRLKTLGRGATQEGEGARHPRREASPLVSSDAGVLAPSRHVGLDRQLSGQSIPQTVSHGFRKQKHSSAASEKSTLVFTRKECTARHRQPPPARSRSRPSGDARQVSTSLATRSTIIHKSQKAQMAQVTDGRMEEQSAALRRKDVPTPATTQVTPEDTP